jgi:hypothetical protein
MREAVEAVVERKLGRSGISREQARTNSAWRDPASVSAGIPTISEAAIQATTAYGEYVYGRYRWFPAHVPAFYANVGFQAHTLDLGFYERHYRAEAITDRHRLHFQSELHA